MSDSDDFSGGFLTVAEAGTFLRLSRSTIYELMDNGELDSAKLGRARRIPRQALLAYAAKHMTRSSKQPGGA